MTAITCCDSGEPGEHEAGCDNHPGFQLIPEGHTLPKLYAQDGLGQNAIVHVKLFLPGTGWTWYLTEYDPADDIAFGWVVGQDAEFGYVHLPELRELRIGPGFRVERALLWTPRTLAEVRRVEPSGWMGRAHS